MLNANSINSKGKLTHLIADDLFSAGSKQIFNAKSGKYMGIIRPGESIPQELNFDAEPEPEIIPEKPNPDQLILF